VKSGCRRVPPSRKATADKEEKTCLSRRSPQGVDGRLHFFLPRQGKKLSAAQ